MMRMSMNLELLSLCSSFDWYSLKLTNLRPGMGFESLTAVHGIIVNYG